MSCEVSEYDVETKCFRVMVEDTSGGRYGMSPHITAGESIGFINDGRFI